MTMRDDSKVDWSGPTNDFMGSINAGSLQRIADATEKMAQSYSALIDERDKYKRWYENRAESLESIRRSNAALRGVITKLKKRKKI